MLLKCPITASIIVAATLLNTPHSHGMQPTSMAPRDNASRDARVQSTVSPDLLTKIHSSGGSLQHAIRVNDFEIPASDASLPNTSVVDDWRERSVPTDGSGAALESTNVDLTKLKELDTTAVRVIHNGRAIDVAGASSVSLPEGAILAVREASSIPEMIKTANSSQASSPTQLIAFDLTGELRRFSLIHHIDALSWDDHDHSFEGTLHIGLVDRNNPDARTELPKAIPIQLQASGALLEPDEVAIKSIGDRMEKVRISVQNPTDPFPIKLLSPVDQDVPPAIAPLRRIAAVIIAPDQIDGLGIGVADIKIHAVNGTLPAGGVITLQPRNATLDTTSLKIDEEGVASTQLRSTSFGEGRVAISGGPYTADAVVVRYVPPVFFFIATLAGAMLGATVFVYTVGRRNDRGRRRIVDWLMGIAVGTGVTIMIYAGIKLPEVIPVPKNLIGTIVPFALAFMLSSMTTALLVMLTGSSPRRSATPQSSREERTG